MWHISWNDRHSTRIRLLPGFTLVELLVVITIIGILAALITAAAVGVIKKAHETEIKAEIDQLHAALEEYKNRYTAYPPNCQIDGIPQEEHPVDDLGRFRELKRHLAQAFPRHQESEDLLKAWCEIDRKAPEDYPMMLNGGICADQALVFWLGGFSSDPKYPISGDGGPSYPIPAFEDPNNRKLDPIANRKWTYPFDVSRLGPRAEDGYFDERNSSAFRRFIEYRDPKGTLRRINLWTYSPRRSEQPYLYFDTSREPATIVEDGKVVSRYDPPARPSRAGEGLAVFAFKRAADSTGSGVPIEFVNAGKFQILHCGADDEWGEEEFARMWARGVEVSRKDPSSPENYLLFPRGPFSGTIADTIVNFTSDTRIEDAQE